MTHATTAAERTSRLLHMDVDLWKGNAKERAEEDGMSRARSRVLEGLLDAYAEGRLSVPIPASSTYGAVERHGCRAKLSDSVCAKAEVRWKRESARKGSGSSPGFGLLCELLLREYTEGRARLRITAEPTDEAESEAA